jgi:hypothetical protein
MTANTTLERTTVAHDGTTYAVSTIHVRAQDYHETCLFGSDAIPFSSIPDAINTIATAIKD